MTYSPEGNLWFKKTYVNGIIDGISFMYHMNGQLRSKSLYDMGIELSTEEYDKKGKLKFKLEFEKDENGKIISGKKTFLMVLAELALIIMIVINSNKC